VCAARLAAELLCLKSSNSKYPSSVDTASAMGNLAWTA
jgi:hypothetical protein